MTRRPLIAAAVVLGLGLGLSAPAEARPRPKDPDGRYVGTEVPEQRLAFDDIVFDFKVKRNGRRITDFSIEMNVVCSGYPLYTEYVLQPMHDMTVGPRTGRFKDVVAGTTEGGTDYRVKVAGFLKGTQVRQGTLSYDVGICQRGTGDDGPVRWKARRESRN
jgi:hypothetical protein